MLVGRFQSRPTQISKISARLMNPGRLSRPKGDQILRLWMPACGYQPMLILAWGEGGSTPSAVVLWASVMTITQGWEVKKPSRNLLICWCYAILKAASEQCLLDGNPTVGGGFPSWCSSCPNSNMGFKAHPACHEATNMAVRYSVLGSFGETLSGRVTQASDCSS